MSQRFGTEGRQEDAINTTFPYNRIFYNLPEAQSRPNSGEPNGRGTGRPAFTSIGSIGLDAFHLPNYSVNPAVLHRQPSHPSFVVGPSQFQHPSAPVAAPATLQQGPTQVGSSAAEAERNSITETSRNPYPSRSNLLPLAPSPSHIVRPRPLTQRQSHTSGSTVDRFDPRHTSHFSSFPGVQGGHHDATSVVKQPQRRGGRHASQRLSPSPIPAPATSTSPRFHPYAASGASVEARHGQTSLASLSSPEPVGLQPTPSQNGHFKLSRQEYASRSELLRNEPWFQNQTEEPLVNAADEFVKRDYISTTDKTRFGAFVGITPGARRAACRIPHEITVNGDSIPCTYEKANLNEAIAHVSMYFGYKGYKCQITEPGHSRNKRFPTRERRNDHQSKANKRPDARIDCALCKKSTLERNMERHMKICKGEAVTESQPER